VERSDGGGKAVQLDERKLLIVPKAGIHMQARNATKGEQRVRVLGSDELWEVDG
jgi:hypothetical protein